MARRLRYGVAMSLDGFIAAADGGYDWIVHDPTIDFGAIFSEFDTLVMGRKTFDLTRKQGGGGMTGKLRTVVVSRTLSQKDFPAVEIVNEHPAAAVTALKDEAGKDIWLFGGGELFRTLFDAGVVDGIDVAVIPVMLGGGIPFIAPGKQSKPLRLADTKTYPSGIISLTYEVP